MVRSDITENYRLKPRKHSAMSLRSHHQAILAAIMFAPAPSFPGAEFGLAAPVILPNEQQDTTCRTGVLSNTFELAAAFGGAAPTPTNMFENGDRRSRDNHVPSGLATLLQAAELVQSASSAPRAEPQLPIGREGLPVGSSAVHTSSSMMMQQLNYSPTSPTSTSSLSLPSGVPSFMAFLRESGSMLSLTPTMMMMPSPSMNPAGSSSVLQQLVLLQHWIPILDRMAPVHKNLLWETCKTYPGFRVTSPKLTSFRKMVTAWGANIATFMPNISALFAAIGYLKHHDLLKNEFYYPDTQQPVFRTFIHSPAVVAPMLNPNHKRSSVALQPFGIGSASGSSPASPAPAAAPSSPSVYDDRVRDRSPDLEEGPRPQSKRSRVNNIADN